MIEGLKIDVTSDELKTHLDERASTTERGPTGIRHRSNRSKPVVSGVLTQPSTRSTASRKA